MPAAASSMKQLPTWRQPTANDPGIGLSLRRLFRCDGYCRERPWGKRVRPRLIRMNRHSRGGGNPAPVPSAWRHTGRWVPAYAGMTKVSALTPRHANPRVGPLAPDQHGRIVGPPRDIAFQRLVLV